jgi:hypothetical protein
VEFGQVHPERPVLKDRQDSFADFPVQRHAVLEQFLVLAHHSRPEDCVRATPVNNGW